MWAMIGVEAVFAPESAGVLQQLRGGARALLGYSQPAAKLISSMYEFRSRFVHGDLDFEGAASWKDLLEEEDGPAVERSRKDIGDALDMAIAILLASIQELIRRGWLGVQFTTTCEAT
jgi:hypothetical protein